MQSQNLTATARCTPQVHSSPPAPEMPLPSEPKMAMEQVASVIRPVSITMLFVVYCVVALCNPYSLSQADCRATGGQNALSLVMVYRERDTDSDGARLGGSILNAVMLVLMFTVITFLMYCLYKYRCMRFIWGYLGLSVGTLLGFFGFQLIYQVIIKYDIVMDYITLGLFLFNWTVVGSARTPPAAPPLPPLRSAALPPLRSAGR